MYIRPRWGGPYGPPSVFINFETDPRSLSSLSKSASTFVGPPLPPLPTHTSEVRYPALRVTRGSEPLVTLGYSRFNNSDHCVYLRQCGDDFTFIAVWVDDLLFVSSSPDSLSAAKKEITSEFEATDQGDPRLLLGIEIARNRNVSEIKISQGQFLRKILSCFNMEDSHPVSTPMANS